MSTGCFFSMSGTNNLCFTAASFCWCCWCMPAKKQHFFSTGKERVSRNQRYLCSVSVFFYNSYICICVKFCLVGFCPCFCSFGALTLTWHWEKKINSPREIELAAETHRNERGAGKKNVWSLRGILRTCHWNHSKACSGDWFSFTLMYMLRWIFFR